MTIDLSFATTVLIQLAKALFVLVLVVTTIYYVVSTIKQYASDKEFKFPFGKLLVFAFGWVVACLLISWEPTWRETHDLDSNVSEQLQDKTEPQAEFKPSNEMDLSEKSDSLINQSREENKERKRDFDSLEKVK